MIIIINPSRLTRQDFFEKLINYLAEHEDVTLRQLKQEFAEVKNMDRQLESYIEAGYIIRENRRYYNGFSLLASVDGLELGQEVFVETKSNIYQDVKQLSFQLDLTNDTNAVIIREQVDFLREKLTLHAYFYRLKELLPLSEVQVPLYELLGDVNPAYALKYMTTFLLKFTRKEVVLQKRPDIFVQALGILGFIEQIDETSYRLTMELDKEELIFQK